MPSPTGASAGRERGAGRRPVDSVGLTTATARAVLGTPDSAARADRVAERLAQAIELGLILDGERLPPESQLAVELGTATVTLREALATLRERGLVETRRGRGGGTFVRRDAAGARSPVGAEVEAVEVGAALLRTQLAALSAVELRELGDHRRAISGTCAALAAGRAVEPEVDRLRQRIDILAAATTTSERRRADSQLALEVAGAAQSSVLAHEEQALHARLGDLLWFGADDTHHSLVVAQHRRLVVAIGARSATRARAVVERRIDADTERLLALRLALYREAGS